MAKPSPLVDRKAKLKRRYGLSIERFNRLLWGQSNACAICQSRGNKTLSVDHCHSSNKIRGLLCSECNFGLGKFKDSIKLLRRAIKYLKKGGAK